MPAGMFDIPQIDSLLASTSNVATPVFNWMLPTALYFLAIVVGSLVLMWLIGVIRDAVGALVANRRFQNNYDSLDGEHGNGTFIEYFKAMRTGRFGEYDE